MAMWEFPSGTKKLRRSKVISEAYPESEFNLDPTSTSGQSDATKGTLSVDELLASLGGDSLGGGGLPALRKRLEQQQRRGGPITAPLPKAIRERLERKAGYEKTSEDVTKWLNLVKQNREAPTLVLNKKPEITTLTTGTIAAKFQPVTDFEKEIDQLLKESGASHEAVEAAEALELNKLTVEEVREKKERLARMRSLLFRSELKAKRVKKIKSKTYHRLMLKSEQRKKRLLDPSEELDPEEAKAAAVKQEFKRAQERMTLKHRNTSKWAKRILERGLTAQNNPEADVTRAAIAEQLRTHQELTRKIHSANIAKEGETDDEEEFSSEEEEGGDGWTQEGGGEGEGQAAGLNLGKSRTKVLAKGKAAVLKELEGDAEAEIPKTGLFALPFMTRAIEKRRKEAEEEAMATLRELDDEAQRLGSLSDEGEEGRGERENMEGENIEGRRSFGAAAVAAKARTDRSEEDEGGEGLGGNRSESEDDKEDDLEEDEDIHEGLIRMANGGKRSRNESGAKKTALREGERGEKSGRERGGVPTQVEFLEDGNEIREVGISAGFSVRMDGPLVVPGFPDELENQKTENNTKEGKKRGLPVSSLESQHEGENEEKEGENVRKERKLSNLFSEGNGPILGHNPGLFGPMRKDNGEGEGEGEGTGRSKNRKRKERIKNGGRGIVAVPSNEKERLDSKRSRNETEVKKTENGTPQEDTEVFEKGQHLEEDKSHEDEDKTYEGEDKTYEGKDKSYEIDEETENGNGFDSGLGLGSETEVPEGELMGILNSQKELIKRAFSGDDVQSEFEEEKQKLVDEEVPRGEGPVTLPGWGQWAHVQKKKGEPDWILKERAALEKKREKALGKRKDASMKHVIISEKVDKKAAKYSHSKVPYPFTSKEAFERSLRFPIGPDFNTQQAFRNMTRPSVIKTAGTIIETIRYQPPANKGGGGGGGGGGKGGGNFNPKRKGTGDNTKKGDNTGKGKKFKVGKD